MARSDSQPAACSSLMVGIRSNARLRDCSCWAALPCGERRGRSPGHNDIDRHRNQFRRQRGVALVIALGKARLKPEIAPFDVAIFLQLVTSRPPHRSVRAAFPHTVPTLGIHGNHMLPYASQHL
jgi:hypothetical protein